MKVCVWRRLLSQFCVDDNGYWTVVYKVNFHIGAEYTRLDWFTQMCCECGHERVVDMFGEFGWSGAGVRRSVTFFSAGEQGELTDHENLAVDVLH